MNPHLRAANSVTRPDWYQDASEQRDRASWHAQKAEEQSILLHHDKVEAHRHVSEKHSAAAFCFDRASRCASDHQDAYAKDHAARGKELDREARAHAEGAGLETYPLDLSNTLGASHGDGPKVGGF